MAYEMKRVKISRALSEETTAFVGELWLDGRKVADCSNRGHGDSVNILYASREAEAAHIRFCETLPPIKSTYFLEGLKVDNELHVSELVADLDLTKTITRQCKAKILFRLKGDKPGQYWQGKYASVERVREKYGDKIEVIFNEDIPAAVKLLRS